MINDSDPFAIDLFRMGPVAAHILKQEEKGKVIAVFHNCFYLDLNNPYATSDPIRFIRGR